MRLRDHFRPSVWNKTSWEGFHGMWPGIIVQQLFPQLPPEYTAEPRVHLGSYYEIDVCAYEEESRNGRGAQPVRNGGLATWSPPFVAKCAGLVGQGVCVSIVDLVTIRNSTSTPICSS
jgi:hypothetical protein